MLMQEPTQEMLKSWRATYKKYKDILKPNRRSAAEIIAHLEGKYPLTELTSEHWREVVIGNVMLNEDFRRKLPEGGAPAAKVFRVENTGSGKTLYDNQDEVFKGLDIVVGLEEMTGFFQIEGSSDLWDEVFAFRGLDAIDLENVYLVAEYIGCLEKFDMLERVLSKPE